MVVLIDSIGRFLSFPYSINVEKLIYFTKRESYYDWWYLDEYLNEVPGAGYIQHHSNLDKRNNEKTFKELYNFVAAAIRQKKNRFEG